MRENPTLRLTKTKRSTKREKEPAPSRTSPRSQVLGAALRKSLQVKRRGTNRTCERAHKTFHMKYTYQTLHAEADNSRRSGNKAQGRKVGSRSMNFEKYAAEGNYFVNQVAGELNVDRNTAAR